MDNTPTAQNVEAYARLTRQNSLKRAVVRLCSEPGNRRPLRRSRVRSWPDWPGTLWSSSGRVSRMTSSGRTRP